MPDTDTLLAYLVSNFPGNTENIATEALRHIFDHSDACGVALDDVIQSGLRGIDSVTSVRTQVIQADGTRPDLVGYDEAGKERVLIEVKFWAGLTEHQPNGYIRALPDDGPALLVFLVPDERVQSLWPQLQRLICQEFDSVVETESERRCFRVGDTQKHVMIVSWGGLLDSMAARSRDYAEVGVETEIRQLRSLAKYADAGAFKPIRRDEEFGADSEMRLRQYKRLVDAATERGIEQEWASRKGLKAVARGYGYGRFVSLRGTVVWFGINVEQFERTGETPLWVDCYDYLQDAPSEVRDDLSLQDSQWAPVALKRDVEFPEILDGVVASLKQIANALHQQGEELGTDAEMHQLQYRRLIDAATERGIEQGWADKKRLNRTPRPYGYGRYIRLHGLTVWFGVNVELFEETGVTPLWVDCYDYLQDKPSEVRDSLGMKDSKWAPVALKRDVEFPEILDGVVVSLRQIADVLHQVRPQSP